MTGAENIEVKRDAPSAQGPEDRTSAPEVGESQRGEPGAGGTAVERSTAPLHDDSTDFDAGHIDASQLPKRPRSTPRTAKTRI